MELQILSLGFVRSAGRQYDNPARCQMSDLINSGELIWHVMILLGAEIMSVTHVMHMGVLYPTLC